MRLSSDLFAIDCGVVVPRIEAFIRDTMRSLSRTGIVVPLSGGLDSSTVAALCARAVGPDKVTGLMLPDRRGSLEALRFGRMVARDLGIRAHSIDMTRLLRAAGGYRSATNLLPSRRLLAWIVRKRLAAAGGSPFLDAVRGSDHGVVRRTLASAYVKQRARVLVTYHYAEVNRLLVVGTAHRSEDLLGLFVKFGIDDSADAMPLKHLYRSHILRIARHVGVPHYVLERTPNPEMIPGVEDKYLDVLKVPSATLDLVLVGLEGGMPDQEIAEQVGLPVAKVEEVRGIVRSTEHMRNPSMSIDPLR